MNTDNLREMMAEHEIPGQVKVTIGWMEEGWNGDYDEEDPSDQPLLRFDAYDLVELKEGEPAWHKRDDQDASYCTQIDGTQATQEELEAFCEHVAETIQDMTSWKRELEHLSWTDNGDLRRLVQKHETQVEVRENE